MTNLKSLTRDIVASSAGLSRVMPALLVGLLLSGCDGPIGAHIDGDLATPQFHFSTPLNQTPCIKDIFIADGRGAAGSHSVWGLYRDNCVKLDHVTYGEIPAGFSEQVHPQPLSANVEYSIFIEGYGPESGGGTCKFAWRSGHWMTSALR